jgi:hypothetical protein
MSVAIVAPLPFFVGRSGPLSGGQITFGQAGQDPDTHPVQVYWDAALLVPASQPLRTINGVISRSGAPAAVYADGDYSMRVRDQNGAQVLYTPSAAEFTLAAQFSGSNSTDHGAGLLDYSETIPYRSGSVGSKLRELTLAGGGGSGTTAKSYYTATIYRQEATEPITPTGGSFDFGSSSLTPPLGWTVSQPATTATPTWAAVYVYQSDSASATVTAGTWARPVIDAVQGAAGNGGISRWRVEVYVQSPTAPAAPVGGSYTFTSDTFVAPSGGWSRSQPTSGSVPTWMAWADLATTTPGTVINIGTWSAPVAVAQNGAAGTNYHTVTIYRQQATAPTAPSGGSYTFATGSVVPPAGWTASKPSASATLPTFASQFTFGSNTPTEPVVASAWSTPFVDSQPGSAGVSTYVGTVYLQQVAAPSAPTGGSYNFATGLLTPPAGWVVSQPNTSSTATWACEFKFSTQTPNLEVSGGTWSAPYIDSIAGGSGESSNTIEVFLQSVAQPATPAGGEYNFSTDAFTPPAGGWTRNQPSATTTPTWRAAFRFATSTPATPVTAGTYTAPIVVAQVGAPGTNGTNGTNGINGTNGTNGTNGQRGSVQASRAVTTAAWSDAEAAAAISSAGYGSPVILDQVTLFNGAASFAETRFWTGSAWLVYQTKINGNLLVDGTIAGTAVIARTIKAVNIEVGTAMKSLGVFAERNSVFTNYTMGNQATAGAVLITMTETARVFMECAVEFRWEGPLAALPTYTNVKQFRLVVTPLVNGLTTLPAIGDFEASAMFSTDEIFASTFPLRKTVRFTAICALAPGSHFVDLRFTLSGYDASFNALNLVLPNFETIGRGIAYTNKV